MIRSDITVGHNNPHVDLPAHLWFPPTATVPELAKNTFCREAPNVFLVIARWVRQRRQKGQVVTRQVPKGVDVSTMDKEDGVVYYVIPRSCIGTPVLVHGNLLLAVRFQQLEWAWYMRPAAEMEEMRKGEQISAPEAEPGLVLGIGVVRGRRSYFVHLRGSKEDRYFVTDEQLGM